MAEYYLIPGGVMLAYIDHDVYPINAEGEHRQRAIELDLYLPRTHVRPNYRVVAFAAPPIKLNDIVRIFGIKKQPRYNDQEDVVEGESSPNRVGHREAL